MADGDSIDARRARLEKARRVSDMLVSSHSLLRDRYHRRARTVEVLVLVGSVCITALTFADPGLVAFFGFGGDAFRVAIGGFSASIFALTLMQRELAWKEKAEAHNVAAKMYAGLKLRMTDVLSNSGAVAPETYSVIMRDYHWVGQTVTAIPEPKFLKLKRHHLLKVETSRLLDKAPGMGLKAARIKLWWRDNRPSSRGMRKERDDQRPAEQTRSVASALLGSERGQ